jgi:hypothetical protein
MTSPRVDIRLKMNESNQEVFLLFYCFLLSQSNRFDLLSLPSLIVVAQSFGNRDLFMFLFHLKTNNFSNTHETEIEIDNIANSDIIHDLS